MNYGVYRYDKKEFVIYFSIGYSIAAVILFLFYHRVFLALVLGFLGGYIFLKCYKKVLVEKRRWQLTMEFKDAMDALSAALAAGYSMDHAMSEARKDLLLLYGGETLMTQELKDICTKLTLSRPLDELLKELGQRSGVEDILILPRSM